MNKKELLRQVGHISQVAGVSPSVMNEGPASGMKVYDVKNGRLRFRLMADKCLDIAELSYRGENVSFLAKPGLMGRSHLDTHGAEAQRSIMGGMLFTCGLENICAPCTVDGRNYPMHGRIRTTPAVGVGVQTGWSQDGYSMDISGEMREAELFGENMVLRRKITTVYPQESLVIEDTVTNEAFRTEPLMLLYHFNLGYPFLGEGCRLILPTRRVTPRDDYSAEGLADWNVAQPPVDGHGEYVFLHELAADAQGNTFAAAINPSLGFGLKLSFNRKNLPFFMEWKSLASGDYVIGLEPANASVYGKLYHLEHKDHPMLLPFESIENRLELSFVDASEFEALEQEKERLLITGNR